MIPAPNVACSTTSEPSAVRINLIELRENPSAPSRLTPPPSFGAMNWRSVAVHLPFAFRSELILLPSGSSAMAMIESPAGVNSIVDADSKFPPAEKSIDVRSIGER